MHVQDRCYENLSVGLELYLIDPHKSSYHALMSELLSLTALFTSP